MTKVHMSNGASNSWVGDNFSSLLVEQIAVMLQKENASYLCVDYLGELPMSNGYLIDEGWRQRAAEWMFKVIDFYDLERDIVNVGMAYMDQMLALSGLHHRWGKQKCNLVAITALKIAIKLLEPRTMNMGDMIKLGMKLGSCSFAHSDVVEMEQEMLWKLSWNVYPPTTLTFAHHMICMFPSTVPAAPTRYIIQELVKYQTELAVCVYNFGVKTKPSSKAFACILNALDALDNDCAVSPNDMATFHDRVNFAFGLRHDDKQLRMLKKELKELLCHNTDLHEFVGLIRQSNKAEYEDSPKTTATSIKTLR